jgi:hypothetical protein
VTGWFGGLDKAQRWKVGLDQWVGCGDEYRLPVNIIEQLRVRGIITLSQVADDNMTTIWHYKRLSGTESGLRVEDYAIWDRYIENLKSSFVRLKEEL